MNKDHRQLTTQATIMNSSLHHTDCTVQSVSTPQSNKSRVPSKIMGTGKLEPKLDPDDSSSLSLDRSVSIIYHLPEALCCFGPSKPRELPLLVYTAGYYKSYEAADLDELNIDSSPTSATRPKKRPIVSMKTLDQAHDFDL
mgnify:CR=1 FL=1